MPLKIWLPADEHYPIIGSLLKERWIAYFFSWFGAIYDLSIGFFLLNKRTRCWAYFFVVAFHLMTGWLFKIGMFPYIMIFLTIIFFSEKFHLNLIYRIRGIISPSNKSTPSEPTKRWELTKLKEWFIGGIISVYFIFQLLIPFRYLLYPGNLFWTEEGYRFSWRVMLMEKSGIAFFYVRNPETGQESEVINSNYLTHLQEKMMSTQPDMILQYAHFLDNEYKKHGIKDPIVTVKCYVTLNGSGSRLFIDPSVDLSKEMESFSAKKWIKPFRNN
jgi:hypothetical protein